MIKNKECLCLNPDCYEYFPVSDAMFKLETDVAVTTVSEKKTDKNTGKESNPLMDDTFAGGDMSENNIAAENLTSSTIQHIERYFKVKDGHVIYDADTNNANKKLDDIYKKYGIHIDIRFNSYENNNNIKIDYTIAVQGNVCHKETGKTLTKRYCPKCRDMLTEHMGFCDWYIVMPVGDSKSGKTTFLRTAHRLLSPTAFRVANYDITTGGTLENELTKERLKERATPPDENLFAYFCVTKPGSNKEVMLLFRDNAGEKLREGETNAEYQNRLFKFTRYVDALLVFTHFYGISGIVNRVENGEIDKEKLLEGMDERLEVKESEVMSTVESIQISKNSKTEPKAAMYVFTMTDRLEKYMNDLKLENNGVFISSNSKMFSKKYIHRDRFDFNEYFKCAFETAYFLQKEDRYYNKFMRLAQNENRDWHRGVTAISSRSDSPRRIDEVFGWLITCLIEKKTFNMPIFEQSEEKCSRNNTSGR